MLKLNKGIHFNILTVFAIVFVCVYLYYTISDLKKIAVEVKKQSTDIANIVTNLANVNKDLGELKKKAAACCPDGVCPLPAKPQINVAAAQPIVQVAEAAPGAPAPPEDDASSVDTNDVKNLLSDIPDGDDDDAHEEPPADAPAPVKAAWADMTIEQLKKECKSAGLSTKGTKDVLVGRLSELATSA